MESRGRELGSCLEEDQILSILGQPVCGDCPSSIRSLSSDDRQLPADLFVAIRGTEFDATRSIPDAILRGAGGIVAEQAPTDSHDPTIPWWRVKDARRSLALLEQAGAGLPGESLRVFGITGTNGKTTTVRYLCSILNVEGRSVGWMTTVDSCIASQSATSRVTTESPALIADALSRHLVAGGTDVVLEISSHAIDQHRVAGVPLVGAAITSLGRDHLDYHETVEKYHQTKLKLGELCRAGAPFLRPVTVGETDGIARFQVEGLSDSDGGIREVTAKIRHASFAGSIVQIQSLSFSTEVKVPQPGSHNVSNALCAIALADACGISQEAIVAGIETCTGVAGRLERVNGAAGPVFIDFAHTPDAMDSVLGPIRSLVDGRLMVLFGCGGDRDPGKRPLMGAAVAKYADRIFVTSDNPRSENPSAIIEQIVEGIPEQKRNTIVEVEVDRRIAISNALNALDGDDALIICGKGHENSQEIAGQKTRFSDREVVLEVLDHHQKGELIG